MPLLFIIIPFQFNSINCRQYNIYDVYVYNVLYGILFNALYVYCVVSSDSMKSLIVGVVRRNCLTLKPIVFHFLRISLSENNHYSEVHITLSICILILFDLPFKQTKQVYIIDRPEFRFR